MRRSRWQSNTSLQPIPKQIQMEMLPGCSLLAEGKHSQPSVLDCFHSHCHSNTTQRVSVPLEASPFPTHHHVVSRSPGMAWLTHADQQWSFVLPDSQSGAVQMAAAQEASVFYRNPLSSPPPIPNTCRVFSASASGY